jgi:DNA-directed RNA polymerase specialized sigma subunit
MALDEALKALATFDERRASIVELHFFGGMSVKEVAEVLGDCPLTIANLEKIMKMR